MARDKEYEMRMQGMIYAYNKVKEEGLEALERDMRRRNVLRVPIKFTEKEYMKMLETIGKNITNNILTVSCTVLNDFYGFGGKRLRDFQQHFLKRTAQVLDLDYMGCHYVTLSEYAGTLVEKYGLEIDTAVVEVCQDDADGRNPGYHMCKVELVIDALERDGFMDAADRLRWRIADGN